MKVSRRVFMRGGVAAFTFSFAAPSFLCKMAEAQGQSSRNLVVLDLTGGNDSLSMLVPYNDSFYYSQRPTLAVPAASVLQVGSDSSGVALGLHPRLTGLRDIFNQGRMAFIQRAGYENSSRSHFLGTDIWSTANPQSSQALRAMAGAMAKGIGTKIFWVQTGGFDTHSTQRVNETNGTYYGLMGTLNDGLIAFYNDLNNQGLLNQTLILQFSEFGRRIAENGSGGTDHGAASTLFVVGGSVRGGFYGTAPNLNPNGNPTLENNGNDVHFEHDFRSVYARVIDNCSAETQRPCWAETTGRMC